MTRPTKDTPATVPLAQQAGEIPLRWRWVEPTVWTVRMVTTLEQGVEGGKWFRLFDKVFAERNLLAAFQQVASKHGAAGVDHVTVAQFERAASRIDLGGLGPIEARHVSAPVDPTRSHPQAGHHRDTTAGYPHGSRSDGPGGGGERDRADLRARLRGAQLRVPAGRGCKDALRRVDQLLKAGYVYVVDADLKGYFDSIPHDRLMARLKEKIADGPVLSLIESLPEGEHPGTV